MASGPPPPSYDDIVGFPSTSGPVFVPPSDTASDSLQRQRPGTSDSPHSSDDEETSFLKSELRRLREENSTLKKTDLRHAIEMERAYSMSSNRPAARSGATGQTGPLAASIYQSQHASSFPQINVGEGRPQTTVQPVVSYHPQQGITSHGITPQPSAPSISLQAPVPGTSSDDDENKKTVEGCLSTCVITSLVMGLIFLIIFGLYVSR